MKHSLHLQDNWIRWNEIWNDFNSTFFRNAWIFNHCMGQKLKRKPFPYQQGPWIPEESQRIRMLSCADVEWIVLNPWWNEKCFEQSCIRNMWHVLCCTQFSLKSCGFRSDQIRQNTHVNAYVTFLISTLQNTIL